MADFEYYNVERLEKTSKEKIICVQIGNFEKAAANRDLEVECQKYVDLKKQFNLVDSKFHYESGQIIYFYFGPALNDIVIREYFSKYRQYL